MKEPNVAIQPTVGRMVWFRPNGISIEHFRVLDSETPCAAQVAYPFVDGRVNLLVTDHMGVTRPFTDVVLRQPNEDAPLEGTPYCEWMPYQQGQAAKPDLEPRLAQLEVVVAELDRRTAGSLNVGTAG